MTNVLISAAGLCGATIIGAILGFFVKELPHKWNDAVLGYCAGIMLAASTLGLIERTIYLADVHTQTAGCVCLRVGIDDEYRFLQGSKRCRDRKSTRLNSSH